MGSYASYHAVLPESPCGMVSATTVYQQAEFDRVLDAFQSSGVTGWIKHIYEFAPYLTKGVYIAKVFRPTARASRSFWVMLNINTQERLECQSSKMPLRAFLKLVYQQVAAIGKC